jgi:phospholipase/carboxylesterase
MLHGRGADGADLIGIADMIGEALPDTAFHAPDAPRRLPGYGFQWFDRDAGGGRDAAMRQAELLINEFIDEQLTEYGLEASKCVLMGFSQGTIMSIHVAPRRTAQLAGVVALSGAIFTGDTLARDIASRPPFVLVHGSGDDVLPASGTEDAARRLDEQGVPVSLHILPALGHGIDQRGLEIATQFMMRVL